MNQKRSMIIARTGTEAVVAITRDVTRTYVMDLPKVERVLTAMLSIGWKANHASDKVMQVIQDRMWMPDLYNGVQCCDANNVGSICLWARRNVNAESNITWADVLK